MPEVNGGWNHEVGHVLFVPGVGSKGFFIGPTPQGDATCQSGARSD